MTVVVQDARRVLQFLRSLRWLRRHGLITRHNLRATWIQSDPDWLAKVEPIECTDEEWDAFMEEIR